MKYYITYEEPYIGKIFTESEMMELYNRDINKSEYPNFEGWLWDMLRSGVFDLFEEIKEEEQGDTRYYVSSVEGSCDVINAEWWFNSQKEAIAFRDNLRRELQAGDHDEDWSLFDGMNMNEIEKINHRAKVAEAVDAYSYCGGKNGKRIY